MAQKYPSLGLQTWHSTAATMKKKGFLKMWIGVRRASEVKGISNGKQFYIYCLDQPLTDVSHNNCQIQTKAACHLYTSLHIY